MRRNKLSLLAALAVTAVLASAAGAALVQQPLQYQDEAVTLRGWLAYDDAAGKRQPGILVVHEWWGLNEFAKQQAQRLGQQGYAVLAVDMYGEGRATQDANEARQWSSQVRQDPAGLRRRIGAALQALRAQSIVDSSRTAAIGFCFGGTVVLELAYSGADVRGVVSLHGGLVSPSAQDAGQMKAAVLVLHGAADAMVLLEQVHEWMRSMPAGADWQAHIFSGAKHSFTNPGAEALNMPGVGYDKRAAERALQEMDRFLAEVLER
jgi:dienelactone hydrolase